MGYTPTAEDLRVLRRYQADWVLFIEEILGYRLDEEQKVCVRSVQHNPRTVIKSGHARGKDFIAAVCSICFLYLCGPSKVISTAPTDRQVKFIMLAEAKRAWLASKVPLGGEFLVDGIRLAPDWFMLGFKAGDKNTEAWTGFHAQNIMVVVTEASGLDQATYDAIEGLLTGNSRLLMVLNPNQPVGECYNAFKSKLYNCFTLNCLHAPNVRAKKTIIPGQVDYNWVNTVLQKPGWVSEIGEDRVDTTEGDFKWDFGDGRGERWLRPGDLARVKVLGMWPKEPVDQLIPLSWVEAANARWLEWQSKGAKLPDAGLILGVDVAGMGNDLTSKCFRWENLVEKFEITGNSEHMETAGAVKMLLDVDHRHIAMIDTIGEGAGVFSRLAELKAKAFSAKFSESAEGLMDVTQERTFANMRAYCYWAVRDALDPKLNGQLMLPPDFELTQELIRPKWKVNSQGRILIEPKEDIAKDLGRSPDKADSLALTYFQGGKNYVGGGWDISPGD